MAPARCITTVAMHAPGVESRTVCVPVEIRRKLSVHWQERSLREKAMKRIIVLLAVLLVGCVNPQVKELRDWTAAEKPRAERGEIKWSEYYKAAYSRLEMTNLPDKGQGMEWLNLLIQAAQLYESGGFTKNEFENFQRTMKAAAQKSADEQSAAARRAFGQALGKGLQDFGNTAYRPVQVPTNPVPVYQPPRQTQCQTIGNQMTCTQY